MYANASEGQGRDAGEDRDDQRESLKERDDRNPRKKIGPRLDGGLGGLVHLRRLLGMASPEGIC